MVRLSPRSFRVVGDSESRPTLSSAPANSEHVGVLLSEARTAAGYKLSDIAYTLRIRYLFLQAIEEGRFADLPGTTYAVGFVRSYADYLGLDAAAVVARFKAETDGARRETSLAFPEPAPDRSFFPGAAVMSLSVVLAAAAFGGWIYLQDDTDVIAERISEPPALPAFDLSRQRAGADAATRRQPAAPARSEPATNAPRLAAADLASEPAAAPDRAATALATDPQGQPAALADAVGEVSPPATRPPGERDAAAAQAATEPTAAQAATEPTAAQAAAEPAAAQVAAESTAAQVAAVSSATPAVPEAAPEGLTSRLSQDAPGRPAAAAPALIADLPSATLPRPAPGPSPTSHVRAAVAAEVSPDVEPPAQLAARNEDTSESLLPAVPLAGAVDENAGRVYGRANRDARITLRATADSWVQVRDGAQNVLLTRMLRAGDSYRVPNKADLWLLTGNAGGLEILVDGEPVAPLGPSGEVRRDVALDATALKAR